MTGIVPTDFKLANIIPVYKTGSRTDLGSYRPISLLSIFNKILEKLWYLRVRDCCECFVYKYTHELNERKILHTARGRRGRVQYTKF